MYLHGFLSSRASTKAQFLRRRLKGGADAKFQAIEFNPTPRDFETMTVTGHINRLRQYLLDHDLGKVSLIGSSFGGLIALRYAHRFGGVERMLLLAPLLAWRPPGVSAQELEHWEREGAVPVDHPAFGREVRLRYELHEDGLRYRELVPPAAPTVIVHGQRDETVPTAASRAYASEYPDVVRLIEVDADHDLNGHLDLIWEVVKSFLLQGEGQL